MFARFRRGLYRSGRDADEVVWSKPAPLTVRAVRPFYSFAMPNAGKVAVASRRRRLDVTTGMLSLAEMVLVIPRVN